MCIQFWLDLLKAVAPLLAATAIIIAAVITTKASLLQVKKNHVIGARIEWLQKLKEHSANFIGNYHAIIFEMEKYEWGKAEEYRRNMKKDYHLIKLNLNYEEGLSLNLAKTLDLLSDRLDRSLKDLQYNKGSLDNLANIVIEITGMILKAEWEVTKSGDINIRKAAERKELEDLMIRRSDELIESWQRSQNQ